MQLDKNPALHTTNSHVIFSAIGASLLVCLKHVIAFNDATKILRDRNREGNKKSPTRTRAQKPSTEVSKQEPKQSGGFLLEAG